MRSILDGHVVLSRHLAHAGRYPAIDVLASVSRLVGEVVSPRVRTAGNDLRALLAAHRDKADLTAIGAYQRGGDPLMHEAVDKHDRIEAFLRQSQDDRSDGASADSELLELTGSSLGALGPSDFDDIAAALAPATATGPSAIPPLNLGV